MTKMTFRTDQLIIIHNTRVCVTNYGTLPAGFEKHLTEFDKFFKKGRQMMIPKWKAIHETHHPIFGKVICVPRNIDINVLTKYFPNHKIITDLDCYNAYTTVDINCSMKPRDDIQLEALNYLEGNGKYERFRKARQQNLFLQTGMGKTFLAIKQICSHKMLSLIVVHKETLITQWVERIKEFTGLSDDEIGIIQGAASFKRVLKNKDKIKIIVASNRTICSALNTKESTDSFRAFIKEMKIGMKIIDEAHISPKITFKLDSETNIFKTLYLTATPKRSSISSQRLFYMILPSINDSFGTKEEHREAPYHNILYALTESSP
jgi:superfamily II DNA or RNA helicase